MPVSELRLAEHVAQVDDLAVAPRSEIDEAALDILHFHAKFGEFLDAPLDRFAELMRAVAIALRPGVRVHEVAIASGAALLDRDRGLQLAQREIGYTQPFDDR